jgi:hypothetical protein
LSLIAVPKANADKRGKYISRVIVSPSQSTHVSDSLTVRSLSASLQNKCGNISYMLNRVKPKIIEYRLCRIASNRKLWCKFEKWCKYLIRGTDKSRKKRSSSIIIYSKTDLLSIVYM